MRTQRAPLRDARVVEVGDRRAFLHDPAPADLQRHALRRHLDADALPAGAKLLVSDGAKVFSESETNDDGVFQKSFEELKSANDVRVFAIDDTHTAVDQTTHDGG